MIFGPNYGVVLLLLFLVGAAPIGLLFALAGLILSRRRQGRLLRARISFGWFAVVSGFVSLAFLLLIDSRAEAKISISWVHGIGLLAVALGLVSVRSGRRARRVEQGR